LTVHVFEFVTAVWNLQLKQDIQLLDNVQHRITRCIAGMKGKTYKECLQLLNLDSIETRWCYFDLIDMFKIINNLNSLDFSHFFMSSIHKPTKGHDLKVFKPFARLIIRKYFFSNCVVTLWNELSADVVHSVLVSSFQMSIETLFKA